MKLIHYEIGDEDNIETVCEGRKGECLEILESIFRNCRLTADGAKMELMWQEREGDYLRMYSPIIYIFGDDTYQIVE